MSLILREQGCSFELRDDSLFWQSVSMVFLSLFLIFFLYEKPLFIGNLIIFNLKFSLSIYWELNYEFNLVFHLIRTFHIGLFFWSCHMAFFIWCCHVAWFHLLIIRIINWRLIWSQIFDHEQSNGCKYIIKFWYLQMPPLQDLALWMIVMLEMRIEVHCLLDWFLFSTFFYYYLFFVFISFDLFAR